LNESIECYDKSLQINPNDHITWNNKGGSLHEQGKLNESIECYEKSLQINPNYHIAWNNKGYLFYDYFSLTPP